MVLSHRQLSATAAIPLKSIRPNYFLDIAEHQLFPVFSGDSANPVQHLTVLCLADVTVTSWRGLGQYLALVGHQISPGRCEGTELGEQWAGFQRALSFKTNRFQTARRRQTQKSFTGTSQIIQHSRKESCLLWHAQLLLISVLWTSQQ